MGRVHRTVLLVLGCIVLASISSCSTKTVTASPVSQPTTTPAVTSPATPSNSSSSTSTTSTPPPPPSHDDIASSLAFSISLEFPSRSASYALLTSRDGYVLKCDEDPCQQDAYKVRFGTSVAVALSGTVTKDIKVMKQAVMDDYGDLRDAGFKYVLYGFPGKGDKTVVLGFSLGDWRKWGTYQQPSDPTLGLITNKNIKFTDV